MATYSKKTTTLANGSTRCYYFKQVPGTKEKVRVNAEEYKKNKTPKKPTSIKSRRRGGGDDDDSDLTYDYNTGCFNMPKLPIDNVGLFSDLKLTHTTDGKTNLCWDTDRRKKYAHKLTYGFCERPFSKYNYPFISNKDQRQIVSNILDRLLTACKNKETYFKRKPVESPEVSIEIEQDEAALISEIIQAEVTKQQTKQENAINSNAESIDENDSCNNLKDSSDKFMGCCNPESKSSKVAACTSIYTQLVEDENNRIAAAQVATGAQPAAKKWAPVQTTGLAGPRRGGKSMAAKKKTPSKAKTATATKSKKTTKSSKK